MSMMEIGGFSPNSNFIGSQGFITEIALATPKELQHDASTVPLDRITMDLGGTAAPLKVKYDDPFVAKHFNIVLIMLDLFI